MHHTADLDSTFHTLLSILTVVVCVVRCAISLPVFLVTVPVA